MGWISARQDVQMKCSPWTSGAPQVWQTAGANRLRRLAKRLIGGGG